MEDSSKKWIHAQTMRRSAAHPDSCSQHTPMPPQGQRPLLVPLERKPDGTYATTRPESNAPIGPMPTAPAGALLRQPVTPPAKSPKQEDPPSTSKRQKISGDESRTLLQTIGSEEKVQHSLCRDSQACREAEPLAQRRDVLAVWQPLPGDEASAGSVLSACGAEQRSVPHGEDLLSDEEQSLQVVRNSLDAHWPEMRASLVGQERWEVLQNLTSARSILASTVTAGRVILEEDRPSVLQALRVLQDVISAEDRPSVLQAMQVLQAV